MNYHVEKDGRIYAPCPGCGQRVELKELPDGEATCKNPGCKSTFPYHVPPGVGPVRAVRELPVQTQRAMRKSPEKWSATDLQTLRELYPVGGSAMVCKALNGEHTRRSINRKAQCLDIRIQTRRTWTEEEDALLRQTYPEGGIKAAFRVLGEKHTKDGIQNRAQRLGLKSGIYKRRPKTQETDFSIQVKPGQTIVLRIEVIQGVV